MSLKQHNDCGSEPNLISIDDALQQIQHAIRTTPPMQLPTSQALYRTLAQDVISAIHLPNFSQSAVDGYALCCDLEDATQQTFQLVGEVRAGVVSTQQLQYGQAIRIFTGGQIPVGTTTIARQEIVETLSEQHIKIITTLAANTDIRHAGEEVQQGQILATQGQKLNVGSIAALSMAGVQQVHVYRQPKVAVLVTGDEVAQSADDLADGKVFDANAPLLQAWFQAHHQQVTILHVADQAEQVRDCLQRLKQQYDVIISTGGVSVGDYDFVRPCAFAVGFEQIFWKVKQKPGKPLFFAKSEDAQHTCYLLGLPGNPAAVYVCMQIYGKTLLAHLQGQKNALPWFSAKLTQTIQADSRERFLRMFAYFEQGELNVRSLDKQQSHMLSNLIHANCLVRIPDQTEMQDGMLVNGLFLDT